MTRDESIKEIQATVPINNKPKDKDSFKKKNLKKLNDTNKKGIRKSNFVDEVKKQIMYGDTGHGLLVDEKV